MKPILFILAALGLGWLVWYLRQPKTVIIAPPRYGCGIDGWYTNYANATR